jgi:hypothetical protein
MAPCVVVKGGAEVSTSYLFQDEAIFKKKERMASNVDVQCFYLVQVPEVIVDIRLHDYIDRC